MNNIIALTKVLLRSLYDTGGTEKKRKRKRESKSSLSYIILMVVLTLCICVPLGTTAYGIAAAMNSTGYSLENLWTIILPILVFVLIAMSVFTIISVFFLSMDNSYLLPLPLKPWEILIARFITCMVLLYIITIAIFVPFVVGIGIGYSMGFIYYLCSFLIVLTMPLMPISVLGIILMIINCFFNFSKHRDLFTYVMTAFAILLGFGISITMNLLMPETMTSEATELANQIGSFYNTGLILSKVLFTIIPTIKALSSYGFGTCILYTLLSMLVYLALTVLFALIGNKFYFKALIGSDEVSTKKVALNEYSLDKSIKDEGVLKSLIINEWQLIMRSPVYFLNLVSIVFLMPIILLVSFGIGFIRSGSSMSELQNLLSSINSLVDMSNSLVFAIVLGILVFLCSINMTSSTAVSRMGSSTYFYKSIPVKPTQIVISKIFWGVIFSMFTTTVVLIIVVTLGMISWYDALVLLFVSIIIYIALNYFGFFLDLRHPHCNWVNETYAVKNNMNSIIYMLVGFLASGLLVGVGAIFLMVPLKGISYIFAGLIAIAGIATIYYYYKRCMIPVDELFEKI